MPLILGTAGYYSRQNWLLTNHVDGWAGMTDWSVPLTHWVTPYRRVLSGTRRWADWVAGWDAASCSPAIQIHTLSCSL